MQFPALIPLLVALSATQTGAAGLDLAQYQISGAYNLPSIAASEASAVTWNWDSDTLFVLGDEGDALVEVDKKTGAQISVMALNGFDDTEGLTYVGGGQFVITEERLQDAYLLTYHAGGSLSRSSLPSSSLGNTVGNVGIEGISYDPLAGTFVAVKEKTPQAVYGVALSYGGNATVSGLFTPSLGVSDISDVQVLTTAAFLAGSADANNLLLLSQESALLLEVSRAGAVLGSFDMKAYSPSAEGVTLDADGTLYVVSESYLDGATEIQTPRLFVLTPVPEPETYALMLAGLALVALARRRQSH